MPTNTSRNRVQNIEIDYGREKSLERAYGLRTHIKTTNEFDENNDWVRVMINFKDSLGKNYGLIEHFKEGSNNSTDHVDLEYENNGELKTETFNTFLSAELRMVEIMKNRLEGI